MPAASPRSRLKAAVQQRSFDPVYVLYGEDDFLKDDMVRQLVDAAVDPSTRDFNLEIRRGSELDGETLGSLLGTPPMMAARRAVVVRDLGGLKKDARAALDRYVERPAPDAVLVLVAAAGTKPDRALLAKATAVEFEPLTGAMVSKWITHHATTVLQSGITAEASALLQSAVGDDLPQLAVELEKLAAYAQGSPIDERAVSEVVGVRRGETLGSLLDAVGERDARRALSLVPPVLAQPKTSGVLAVMALTVQMLALGWGRAMRQRGMTMPALSREFFTFLRESGAFPGRPWGEAVSAWMGMLDKWTDRELDEALAALLEADLSFKETRVSSDEQMVTTLVLRLCAGRPAAAAAGR
jgi:DNA polymerase-3 subunit delta